MTDCLESLYKSFNKSFFRGNLPRPNFVPNLQRRQTFYFRSPAIIEVGSGFAEASKERILDDLLHSMIHLHNWSVGKPDVTRNQYHRNEFSALAVKLGLFVAYQHTRGWAVTASNRQRLSSFSRIRAPECRDRLRQIYEQVHWPAEEIAKLQDQINEDMIARPRKQFQFKYVCNCDSPFIVRVGRRPDSPTPFQAVCNYCNTKFVLAD